MTYLMVKEYLYFIYKASCTKYLCFFTDVGINIVKKENDTVFFTKAPFLWRKVVLERRINHYLSQVNFSKLLWEKNLISLLEPTVLEQVLRMIISP